MKKTFKCTECVDPSRAYRSQSAWRRHQKKKHPRYRSIHVPYSSLVSWEWGKNFTGNDAGREAKEYKASPPDSDLVIGYLASVLTELRTIKNLVDDLYPYKER